MLRKHTLSFYYYTTDVDEIADKVFELAEENGVDISYFEYGHIRYNVKVKFAEVITEEFKDRFKRTIKESRSN